MIFCSSFTSIADDVYYGYYEVCKSIRSLTHLLLYKGWITIREWEHYLFILRLKKKIQKGMWLMGVTVRRKTVKSLSPIRRYRPGGRK